MKVSEVSAALNLVPWTLPVVRLLLWIVILFFCFYFLLLKIDFLY